MTSASSIDRRGVDRWIDKASAAAAALGGGDVKALDHLRAALQGLALVEGLPSEFARDVMRIARSMFDVGDGIDGETAADFAEQFTIVQSSLASLMTSADEHAAAPNTANTVVHASVETAVRTMSVPNDPLVGEFVSECEEHLQAAEEALLELEGDPKSGDLLNAIFRCFHTIKGGAGLLGLDAVADTRPTKPRPRSSRHRSTTATSSSEWPCSRCRSRASRRS
jgi:HPt (histidine-containing phosphotransfer) domain-containing protein